MKKLLILSLILLPALLFSRQLNIKVADISTVSTGNNTYQLTTAVLLDSKLNQVLDDKTVKIPVERYIIKGSIAGKKINEADFLFSQFPLDINNNGSYKDSYPAFWRHKKLYINNRHFSSYMQKRTFENFSIFEGRHILQRITPEGPPVILYESSIREGTITIGAGSKEHPVSVVKLPNPSLQIIVAGIVENIKKKPPFRIEGEENYVTFTNETIFADQADSWVALVWTSIPLRKNGKMDNKIIIKSTIRDIKPPFLVIARINLTVGGKTRLRSRGKSYMVR